jgi:protein-tyrosine phosphatase
MIDLHCHILPAVDDGPQTLDEALALARRLVSDGITHVTATPHHHRFTRMPRSAVLPHVTAFNEELRSAEIPLAVLPGSEIQVIDVATYQEEYLGGELCHLGDDPTYSLLEFPWSEKRYPAGAPELIKWILKRGTKPILAHPERHGFFRDDPLRLRELVAAGAWIQVTVDSLLGNFGPEAQWSGEELLRSSTEAVLATDAHNENRCSGLSAGYAWVRERLGSARAEDLRARADRILRHLTVRGRGDD